VGAGGASRRRGRRQRRALRDCSALGHEREIFALTIDENMRDEVRPWNDDAARQGEVTILHYAGPLAMTSALATLPGARVLYYHNVTPARFFAPFDAASHAWRRSAAANSRRWRAAVDSRARRVRVQPARPRCLGFARTGVLPIIVRHRSPCAMPAPVPAIEKTLRTELTNILFVGRIAPKQEDSKITSAWPKSTSAYVDGVLPVHLRRQVRRGPPYFDTVRALIVKYQDVVRTGSGFTGPCRAQELAAYYRNAHEYVSLSELEGFCVPLVEAMAMDVAGARLCRRRGAGDVGGAGVSFAPKDLEYAAGAAGGLSTTSRSGARHPGQRRRLGDFGRDRRAAARCWTSRAKLLHRSAVRHRDLSAVGIHCRLVAERLPTRIRSRC
jgi:hypothetical protein